MEFLPAHTPELQPAEGLRPIINEPLCNQTFENLSQMEDIEPIWYLLRPRV
ncbi:MAG: hypothetical protein MGG11_03275 [Trichodesmium sp. MAG_R03]|nr:hypothetical protein [Trichodesmium sp. MAG_R03]